LPKQLREFTLRFNEFLGLKRPVLEKLEDFGDFDDVTAKGERKTPVPIRGY
jgi:hypothetical protein